MSFDGAYRLDPSWDSNSEPWRKWFAWHPVKLHGKKVWLQYVFRRQIGYIRSHGEPQWFEYGTLFDVLKA